MLPKYKIETLERVRAMGDLFTYFAYIVERDQPDEIRFASQMFSQRDNWWGSDEGRFMELSALGVISGLFSEDERNTTVRLDALRNLLRRVGQSGIPAEEIDAIAAESEKPQAA